MCYRHPAMYLSSQYICEAMLQNGTVAETRSAFDATFTQINMNHSEPGKWRPQRSGAVSVWPSDNRKVKRRRRFPHWHAPWTRRRRRRYARVTLEFAQRTHSSFRAGENASGSDKIQRMDFTLVVLSLSRESHLECRNHPSYQSVFPSGQQGGCKFLARHRPDFAILLPLLSN